MLSKRHAPLSRKEKSFFSLTAILCIGVGVFGHLSSTPQVDIPVPPALPTQNAYTFYTSIAPTKLPVDNSMDDIPRTPEEKAWLYSLSRRKAWLKANATTGASLQKGLYLPYRHPIKKWSEFILSDHTLTQDKSTGINLSKLTPIFRRERPISQWNVCLIW